MQMRSMWRSGFIQCFFGFLYSVVDCMMNRKHCCSFFSAICSTMGKSFFFLLPVLANNRCWVWMTSSFGSTRRNNYHNLHLLKNAQATLMMFRCILFEFYQS